MKKFTKIVVGSLAIVLLSVGCGQKQLPQQLRDIDSSTAALPVSDKPTVSGKPVQFVVLAFDGSRSPEMWGQTLDFASQMKIQEKPIHFTYFLSGVYFLNYRKAGRYQPPKKPAGSSLIGFGDSNNDVERRIGFVNRAIAEGHEIGSHANGHFDGSKWSYEDWKQELDEFSNLIFNAAQNNDVSAKDAERFAIDLQPGQLVGFRAPELGRNETMLEALKDEGYMYDASGANLKPDQWPKKTKNGLWEFPLAKIPYAGNVTSTLLSMDYNFYFKQSNAKDIAAKGTELWGKFYDDTYESYIDYFNQNYHGSRAPVFIGSHFSEWNDGAYWEAMRDFAQEVCGKPEVECGTFNELKQYMEQHPELEGK